MRKIKEVEAEAIAVALYVLLIGLSFMKVLHYISTEDSVLRNQDSRVTRHPLQPVPLDRTQYQFPHETNLGSPSKRKERKSNDGYKRLGYKRLKRRPGKKRGG